MNNNPLEKGQIIEAQKSIDNLLQGFNGATITNSEGKKITLTCNSKRIAFPVATESIKIKLWLIEFRGYPGAKDTISNPNQAGHALNGNYIEIGGDPSSKRIIIAYALLNHPDLRGKRVFSKIRSMLAEKLAEKPFAGFKIYRDIVHEQTKNQLQKIFQKYKTSAISWEEMKKAILNNYNFQSWISLGHNKFHINFEGNNADIIEVTSERDLSLEKPMIEITINGESISG